MLKVRELLSDESKWTKGTYARNSENIRVYATSLEASRWCLVGALRKCYPGFGEDYYEAQRKIENTLGHSIHSFVCYLPDWNDAPERTFKEVKDLVNKANV